MSRLCHAILLVALLCSARAHAQGTADGDPEALIDRGVDLRVQSKDAEALALFEASWKLKPSPRARAQMALAEQALGRWVDAEKHLEQALADRSDPWIGRNRTMLEDGLRAVQSHLTWLQVESNVAGSTVSVNGNAVGSTPMKAPVRIVRASLVIEVSSPGYVTTILRRDATTDELVRESVNLAAERHSQVAAAPAKPAASADSSRPAAPDRGPPSSSARTWGWIAGGAGVVGLVGTGVLAGLALSKKSGLPQECRDAPDRNCTPEEGARINDARSYAGIANVTFGIGLAGIGIGSILLLTSSSPPPRNGRLVVAPSVGAGWGGVEARGAF